MSKRINHPRRVCLLALAAVHTDRDVRPVHVGLVARRRYQALAAALVAARAGVGGAAARAGEASADLALTVFAVCVHLACAVLVDRQPAPVRRKPGPVDVPEADPPGSLPGPLPAPVIEAEAGQADPVAVAPDPAVPSSPVVAAADPAPVFGDAPSPAPADPVSRPGPARGPDRPADERQVLTPAALARPSAERADQPAGVPRREPGPGQAGALTTAKGAQPGVFVATPRKDARRPSGVSYRYEPYTGQKLGDGQFLAVKEGRRYRRVEAGDAVAA